MSDSLKAYESYQKYMNSLPYIEYSDNINNINLDNKGNIILKYAIESKDNFSSKNNNNKSNSSIKSNFDKESKISKDSASTNKSVFKNVTNNLIYKPNSKRNSLNSNNKNTYYPYKNETSSNIPYNIETSLLKAQLNNKHNSKLSKINTIHNLKSANATNDNNSLNKKFTSSIKYKSDEGISFSTQYDLDLKEIKTIENNLHDLINYLYSKVYDFYIPSIEDIKQKELERREKLSLDEESLLFNANNINSLSKQIDNTNTSKLKKRESLLEIILKNSNNKNDSLCIDINMLSNKENNTRFKEVVKMVLDRIDVLYHNNVQQISQLISNNRLKYEIDFFISLEKKFLMSMDVVLKLYLINNEEDEKNFVNKTCSILFEIYQTYIYLIDLLIDRIPNEKKEYLIICNNIYYKELLNAINLIKNKGDKNKRNNIYKDDEVNFMTKTNSYLLNAIKIYLYSAKDPAIYCNYLNVKEINKSNNNINITDTTTTTTNNNNNRLLLNKTNKKFNNCIINLNYPPNQYLYNFLDDILGVLYVDHYNNSYLNKQNKYKNNKNNNIINIDILFDIYKDFSSKNLISTENIKEEDYGNINNINLKKKENFEYTLVLDLDETLIYYENNKVDEGKLHIRPGAIEFLRDMSKYYEIIIFTAATKQYADKILNFIDYNNDIISHRLYRNHTSISGNNYFKDISKIGRDLKKTIIIDNVWDNFKLQQKNGIYIKTWEGDLHDTWLFELKPLLVSLVQLKIKDVTVFIQSIRDIMFRLYMQGEKNPFKIINKNLLNLLNNC